MMLAQRWTRLGLALGGAILGGMLGTSASAATGCDRSCLDGFMSSYLAKLQSGRADGIPVAPGAVLRENSHPVQLGEGLWRLAGPIKSTQTFADPSTGNVWSYTAMQLKGGQLAQISVRLKIAGRRIAEIETLANTGMRSKDAPYPGGPYDAENLLEQSILYMAPVPPSRRSTRAELIKIADGYFEAIGTHNPNAAKFGARCERYESGSRGTNQLRRNADQGPGPTPGSGNTGAGPAPGAGGPPPGPAWSGTCGSSLTTLTGQQTVERRYPIVDVELGVVVGYMFIQHHERTPPMDNFINEMFKVVDGKIQQADAVGFNLPAPATSGFK